MIIIIVGQIKRILIRYLSIGDLHLLVFLLLLTLLDLPKDHLRLLRELMFFSVEWLRRRTVQLIVLLLFKEFVLGNAVKQRIVLI